jgi:hypothetical protein
MYATRGHNQIEYMERDFANWREVDAVFLGRLLKGS